MPRKPDRFERTVEKAQDSFEALYLGTNQIVTLLRRQHREMVRMIQAHNRSIQSFSDRDIQQAWKDGYGHACMELLNKIKQYAK